MEEYLNETASNIASNLITFEDLKNKENRPKGQTLYYQEAVEIMEKLKLKVLEIMGYQKENI